MPQTPVPPDSPVPPGLPVTALPPVHEAWLPRQHSLHRPRHGGRQLTALICALIFFAAPLIALAVGARPNEFENRALQPFPSPAHGWAFFQRLPAWATDHMVLRQEAIDSADLISHALFGEAPETGSGGTGGPIPGQPAQPQAPTKRVPVRQVVEGTDGWLYLGDEIESRCNMKIDLDKTFQRLRALRDGVEASGRKFVLVIAPDKLTVEPGHLPSDLAQEDCVRKPTAQFWQLVAKHEFVVDLRDELAQWEGELGRPVYPPLDAHWTDEGGVLLTRAIAEAAEPGITQT
ncbi:MAG: alginate O-acetyltransferase AlgX-related protein, partial [Thermocrispum sp.]